MGTSDKHKVCFEVLGVPVIIRALETYNLCGAMLNVVVVGSMAESVMATVIRRFPGTPYAFQDKPHGTGDAARKGAELLERMRFDGNVLVVAPRTRAVSSTLWRITGGTNFINPNSSRTAFAISRPSSSGQPAAINRNRVTVHIIRCR